VPSSTTFDYEWATVQHQLGCRAAVRVVVPESIPAERLRRYGLRPPKLLRYPGLKEEYYLADFAPDPRALADLGLGRERVLVVMRPPAEIAAYHLGITNELFPVLLDRLGRADGTDTIVIARTDEQRESIASLGLPSLLVPERAVDAQSLIAFADVVVSAGGTMNREAVALGVPVYTTFSGRLGGVDEALIAEGKLRLLENAASLPLEKREPTGTRTRRDPARLLELLLTALG
jgi:predicted glycosyltransferase